MAFVSKKMMHVDGKMHHLGTDENDVSKTAVLTANMEEVTDIANLLEDSYKTGLYREYLTYKGKKHDKDITVMSTGNGCMPMAIAIEELNHLGVRNYIKVGHGYSVQPGVKPGTLVLGLGAMRGEGATLEYVNYQYPAVVSMELMGLLEDEIKKHNEEYRTGIFRSHDAYYVDSPFAYDANEKFEKWQKLGIELIEHEVSTMYVLSTILKLNSASIYVVAENFTDGTKLTDDELKERLEVCYNIALEVAALADEIMD